MEDLSSGRVLDLQKQSDLGALLVALANAGMASQFYYHGTRPPMVVVKISQSDLGFVAVGADAGLTGCEVGCLACIGNNVTKTDSWKSAYTLGEAVRKIDLLCKRMEGDEES